MKFFSLNLGKSENDELLNKIFQPVVEPLRELVIVKERKQQQLQQQLEQLQQQLQLLQQQQQQQPQ